MKNKIFEVEDLASIRARRQIENWDRTIENNFKGESVNPKAMTRVLEYFGLSIGELEKELQVNPPFKKALALYTSVNASRQGTRDEKYILEGIARRMEMDDIFIESYTTDAKVPIRSGQVLPRSEAKKKYSKDQMLKSFDFGGKVSYNINIEGFAKVFLGKGGHQDNVRIETEEFIKWADLHGESNTIYVALIDTDQEDTFQNLKTLAKKKGNDNIWVENHKTLQHRLISIKKDN